MKTKWKLIENLKNSNIIGAKLQVIFYFSTLYTRLLLTQRKKQCKLY